MTTPDPNDRDRWLREALRHAPDAERPVPDAVAETILRAARTQTARPRPAEAAPPRARRWAWLDTLGRPQNAGALASVLLATVIGVIWWDMPDDVALPPPPKPESRQAPSLDTAPVTGAPDVATAPTAARPAAPEAARSTGAEDRAQPTPTPPRPRTSTPPPTSPTTTAGDKRSREPAPAARPEAAPDAAAAMKARETEAPPMRSRSDVPVAAAPAPVVTAPPDTGAPGTTVAGVEQLREERLRRRAETLRREQSERRSVAEEGVPHPAPLASTAPPAESAIASAAGSAAPMRPAPTMRAAAPAPAPWADMAQAPGGELARVRATVAHAATSWRWQGASPTAQPVDASVLAWLAALDADVADRWQPVEGPGAGDGPPDLQLLRADVPVHRWWLTGDRVRWQHGVSGRTVEATLPPVAARALKARLDALP